MLLAALIMALPLYSSTSVTVSKKHHTIVKAATNKTAKIFTEDAEIIEGLEEYEPEDVFIPVVFSFYIKLSCINQKQVATFNLNHAIALANTCPRYLLINRLTI
jgi:hypothetical protein